MSLIWISFLLATIYVPGGWIKTKPRKAVAAVTALAPPGGVHCLEQV
jgi:hypothetical protein